MIHLKQSNFQNRRSNCKAVCLLTFLVALFLFACSGGTGKSGNFHNTDIKPDTSIIRIAKRFDIKYFDGYSQLSVISPWQGAGGTTHTWYLVPRGSSTPQGVDTSFVIFVPVRTIVCMSTTHLAMIKALGATGTVTGFSGTDFLYDTLLIEKVTNGSLKEIGYEDNLNKELIISLNPDLVMTYGVGSESSGYTGKIRELGFRVLFNADYLETDPLGKAEWIKVFGALYCKEQLADSLFRSIEAKYNELRDFIAGKIGERPTVMLGLPFKDTWYISPGNSYISKMIKDAGGRYLWENINSDLSMPTSLESVYLKAVNAGFWLNIGTVNSKDEITSVDSRLSGLSCFKNGNLYNNNNLINSTGGNDYWESGCINPHLLLRDLAVIFHPELFRDKSLHYYRIIK